jgi:hypothetical protein
MQICTQKRQRVCSYRRTQRKLCVEALLEASIRIFSRVCKMKTCRGIRLAYKERYRQGHSYRPTGVQRVLIAISTERL